jgi:predicted secreted hydrolase
MLHRRFFLKSALATVALPLFGLPGCGGESKTVTNGPVPIPASASVLRFPLDHYAHIGAPTEWWWHVGTLKAGERTFGFEICATSYARSGYAFTQVMLADVHNNRHYQRTTPYFPPLLFNPDTWAESDVNKDWAVSLGDASNYLSSIEITDSGSGYSSEPTVTITGGGGFLAEAKAVIDTNGKIAAILLLSPGSGFTSEPSVTITGGGGTGARARAFHSYVAMHAPRNDPTQNMVVKALLIDQATGDEVDFDLTLSQEGLPFIVWGTGVTKAGSGTAPLQENNYYYSLTRLHASGSISVGGERFEVSGVTWMDHEYGAFGSEAHPVKWILQDMQLDNGVCISNYSVGDTTQLSLNKTIQGKATIQRQDGTTYFESSTITPIGRTWTSPASGKTFFMQLRVEIPSFDATFIVTSLMDAQEFPFHGGSAVYEGVARAEGTFEGRPVSGTAWSEQAL